MKNKKNKPQLVPPKSPYSIDPWNTRYIRCSRSRTLNGTIRYLPMMLPIQVVLDTFLIHARAKQPIDVRVYGGKFNR